ncbi:hypothetical protein PF004_g12935 [Phytophthora fragariae]|uniref:Uncharacterized protein n=1 Tax=Phytophthora fragariae TaxID=53985 RepID=A0A6G0NTT1_9STRA|nr:hypothetical protein PF004_g12935 [Phytophthora fragariae]
MGCPRTAAAEATFRETCGRSLGDDVLGDSSNSTDCCGPYTPGETNFGVFDDISNITGVCSLHTPVETSDDVLCEEYNSTSSCGLHTPVETINGVFGIDSQITDVSSPHTPVKTSDDVFGITDGCCAHFFGCCAHQNPVETKRCYTTPARRCEDECNSSAFFDNASAEGDQAGSTEYC